MLSIEEFSEDLRSQSLIGCTHQGDAMEPTLRTGDKLIVDPSDVIPRAGVFVIQDQFGLHVQRLEPVLTNKTTFKLICDNEKYTTQEVGLEDFQVVGRVVSAFRKM